MARVLECPIDFVIINQNKVRVTAGLVLAVVSLFLAVPHWTIPLFLGIDFYLRAFNEGQYSPLGFVAEKITGILKLGFKKTDAGPKRFAALVGFIFCDLIFIASFMDLHTVAFCLDVVILLFAFLESVFALCAGCYLYTLLKGSLKKQVFNPEAI